MVHQVVCYLLNSSDLFTVYGGNPVQRIDVYARLYVSQFVEFDEHDVCNPNMQFQTCLFQLNRKILTLYRYQAQSITSHFEEFCEDLIHLPSQSIMGKVKNKMK